MLRDFYKKLLIVVLAGIMIMSALPMTAVAATGTVNGVYISTSGGTSSISGGKANASVTTTSKTDSCTQEVTYTTATCTLTIKNQSGNDGILSFSYSLTLNGGTAAVDGTGVASNGTFSKSVPNGESITVTITSPANSDGTSSLILTDFAVTAANAPRDITVNGTTGGTVKYTLDGSTVTVAAGQSRTVSVDYETGLTLTATASSAYVFGAWVDGNGNIISTTATYTINPTANMTLSPVFADKNGGIFKVGNKPFTTLTAAISYAQSSSNKDIIPIRNCTVVAGNYTIPSDVTLLVPFDEGNTKFTSTPEVVYGSHKTPSAFRTLTLAENANITVASGGKICVPSRLSAYGQGTGSWNGTPTDKHGRINMSEGSSITLQSGAGMYVYGYVAGTGTVEALSGSEVYECFQIRSWRGGSATTGMKNGTVFPMNQYYIQNIEAPLTIHAGATEKVYTSVNMSSTAYPTSTTFIGTDGLFVPSSGALTKRYDGATDRLIIDVNGNFTLSSMNLSLAGINVNTGNYVLPIANNMTINVSSGIVTVNSNVALIPGSQFSVAKGANVSISSSASVFVYDSDEWGDYAGGSGVKMIPVGYSTVNGTTAKRNDADLVDVVFDINGTLNLSGKFYTTTSGADITSSTRSGRINFNSAAGTTSSTQQVTQNGTSTTKVNIGVTAARLHNRDGSYTATAGTAANSYYTYSLRQNKWISGKDNYDVNEDGVEDINDVSFILSACVGEVNMTSSQASKAELTGDNAVDAFDAARLEIYFVG